MKRLLAGLFVVALGVGAAACSSESEPYDQQEAFDGAYALLTSIPKFADATESEAHQVFRDMCRALQDGKDAGMSSDEVLAEIGAGAGIPTEEMILIGGGAVASSCVSLLDWVD